MDFLRSDMLECLSLTGSGYRFAGTFRLGALNRMDGVGKLRQGKAINLSSLREAKESISSSRKWRSHIKTLKKMFGR